MNNCQSTYPRTTKHPRLAWLMLPLLTLLLIAGFTGCNRPQKDDHSHTEVIDPAVTATCMQTGLTEGKHCSTCDKVLVAQEIILMAPHTEAIDPAVPATCEQSGLTEGKHCNVCYEVLLAQKIIPPAHSYENGVCTLCNIPMTTEGLKLKLSKDGTHYIVTGIGTATGDVISLPTVHEGLPVTEIGERAFANSKYGGTAPYISVKEVYVPAGYTSIGASAFEYTDLHTIHLPETLISIESSAFRDCSSLAHIDLPDSLTHLGVSVFAGCSITTQKDAEGSLQYNDRGLCYVDGWLVDFTEEVQSTISIAQGTRGIADIDYPNRPMANFRQLVIPSSVQHIGMFSIRGPYSIEQIILDESNPYYLSTAPQTPENTCIVDRRTLTLVMGNGDNPKLSEQRIQHVARSAFQENSLLTKLRFSDDLLTIGSFAFYRSNLKTIYIGTGLIWIESNAFSGLSNCTIHYSGTKADWERITKETNWADDITIRCTDGEIHFIYQ